MPSTSASPTSSPRTESLALRLRRVPATVQHAFASFLGVPTLVVGAFLLLAWMTYILDQRRPGPIAGLSQFLQAHLFADANSTAQVLSTIAGGMITLTSITFSLLLVALQQSAGSMTHAVFDQFMRRRLNQLYAGWFIGLTLFTLITLASVAASFNPIIGATVALILASGALYVLLLLIYSAIEQMRPESILETIHDHALQARERQLPLLRRTRRPPALLAADAPAQVVRAAGDGFVTAVDLDALAQPLAEAPGVEILLCLPIGGYAAYADPIAEVRGASGEAGRKIGEAVERAIHLERARDLDRDAAFGIEQIETIAWTAISTSKQDPAPGREAVRNLRDLLARWIAPDDEDEHTEDTPAAPLAVVYPDDVLEQLMTALESLAVVTTESMQHQVYAEILTGLAAMLDRLPPPLARRTEALVLRSLAGMGDHMLTAELERALAAIVAALRDAGLADGAAAVARARDELALSIGELNSRGTRVQRPHP